MANGTDERGAPHRRQKDTARMSFKGCVGLTNPVHVYVCRHRDSGGWWFADLTCGFRSLSHLRERARARTLAHALAGASPVSSVTSRPWRNRYATNTRTRFVWSTPPARCTTFPPRFVPSSRRFLLLSMLARSRDRPFF